MNSFLRMSLVLITLAPIQAVVVASASPIQLHSVKDCPSEVIGGITWSCELPEQYVNCISVRDKHGRYIKEGSFGTPYVGIKCQTHSISYGLRIAFDGETDDLSTVTDSDAQRACKAIGGRLPTEEELEVLLASLKGGDNEKDFISSTIVPETGSGNGDEYTSVLTVGESGGKMGSSLRRTELGTVKCVLQGNPVQPKNIPLPAYAGSVSWKTVQGTNWSSLLNGRYANCISEKDESGKPILTSTRTVKCLRDSYGALLGTSADGKSVDDSDAIQVCRSIGGRLPTQDEYEKLSHGAYLQLEDPVDGNFFSSTLLKDEWVRDPRLSSGFAAHQDINSYYQWFFNRKVPLLLRCVK